jgi:hypothetical protein
MLKNSGIFLSTLLFLVGRYEVTKKKSPETANIDQNSSPLLFFTNHITEAAVLVKETGAELIWT